MRSRASVSLVAIAVAVRAFVGTISPAHAQVPLSAISCLGGITKEARKFVHKKLRTYARCNNDNLKAPDRCPSSDLQVAIANLETNLREHIGKKCAYPYLLEPLGYPGPCNDADPLDDFTIGDLEVCIAASHEAIVDSLIDITYGTASGPLGTSLLKCQAGIANAARTYAVTKLKLVQKCETSIVRGTIVDIRPGECATADPTTAAGIAEAESKARARIAEKCIDDQIAVLDVCLPRAMTVAKAEDCILETYGDAVDSMIGIEYPMSSLPVCGDDLRRGPDEECDGTDDAACPGACGPPNGAFPCLCLTIPRQRVIEHANADLDYPWSHDAGVVEGGGYVVDLYDCDGPGGPDTLCTVGPSCSGGAHAPCSNDAQCAALSQGTCRKDRTAVGPHCETNIQQTCSANSDCTGTGNFCVKTLHGAPHPLAAGAVAVCVVNEFTEDVTGTTDLAAGSSAVRLRQDSTTYFGDPGGGVAVPCPVCGGFCTHLGLADDDKLCTTDADCAAPRTCVTQPICSRGLRQGKDCRPDLPFGGATATLGTTSVDCLPSPPSISDLDILFDPQTTGTVTLTPNFPCSAPDAGSACIGGPNDGRPCAAGSNCPSGTCSPQCFCPGQQQPNACAPACVGGANDAAPCGADSDCAGGFCHTGDCRLNPEDTDSVQEGRCSVPAGRECFVNSGIVRQGSAGVPERTTAGVHCMPPTGSSAVNYALGLPGPVALTQPETTIEVGL